MRIDRWAKGCRLARGMSQRQLARKARVSVWTVIRAEGGGRGGVGVNAALSIGQALGVRPREVLKPGERVFALARVGLGRKRAMVRTDCRTLDITDSLRLLKWKRKMPLPEIARGARLSRATVANANRGERVSLRTAERVGHVFGKTVRQMTRSGHGDSGR